MAGGVFDHARDDEPKIKSTRPRKKKSIFCVFSLAKLNRNFAKFATLITTFLFRDIVIAARLVF